MNRREVAVEALETCIGHVFADRDLLEREVAARTAELLRANPGVRPEKLVSAHVEGDNGEGVRGSRAKDWRLVDEIAKPAAFEAAIRSEVDKL